MTPPPAASCSMAGTCAGSSLAFIRRQVALVLQDPVIFHATVWENICYGLEGTARADAIMAARAVGIDDIIAPLPGGYDNMISERGQTLSGGQRQCISIARAMLSRRPSSSSTSRAAASTRSPRRLLDAVNRLTAKRTALIIAHRLKTVLAADEILVLDQ